MLRCDQMSDLQDDCGRIQRAFAAIGQGNLRVPSLQYRDRRSIQPALPQISQERINQSRLSSSTPINLLLSQPLAQEPTHDDDPSPPNTVLYLAYGSNLAASTFLGMRGIRPLAALNVVVPSLALTFDLAGLPYNEPCFANTRRRIPTLPPSPPPPETTDSQNLPLFSQLQPDQQPPKYHKDTWTKGLVGVVYEVTPSDYAHIIATEGGGMSYHDILVPCHILPPGSKTVPLCPTSPSFLAHTLFAPTPPPNSHDRTVRPDPSYAQPSPRYLSLITTGAAEHSLPDEYKTWLATLEAYRTTSEKQRMGSWIFLSMWAPVMTLVFWLFRTFSNKEGRSPVWVVEVARRVFIGVWMSYDGFFKETFGDGERTVEGDEEVEMEKDKDKMIGADGVWDDEKRLLKYIV